MRDLKASESRRSARVYDPLLDLRTVEGLLLLKQERIHLSGKAANVKRMAGSRHDLAEVARVVWRVIDLIFLLYEPSETSYVSSRALIHVREG